MGAHTLTSIGVFRIVEEMARGNTGRVFLAEDPKRRTGADGLCVVKSFDAVHVEDQRFLNTLRREAPAAVRFSHVFAARTIDVAYDGQLAYVVRELVPGMSAGALIDQMRLTKAHLPWEFVVTLGVQLARLFGTAQRFGGDGAPKLHHGALGDSSVYITFSGMAKVVGLGLAQSRALLSPGCRQLPYRAPELLTGQKISAATDVYGIGALMHALLIGRRPFDGDCGASTREAVVQSPPIPPRAYRPEIPEELEQLVLQMMAKRPADRPRDLAGVEGALRSLLSEPDAVYSDGLAQTMAIYFPHLARAAEDRREDWLARRRLVDRPAARASARPWPARPSRPPEESELERGRRNTSEVMERLRTPRAKGTSSGPYNVIQGPWADQVTPSLEGIDQPGAFDVAAVVDAICSSQPESSSDPLDDLIIEPPEEAIDAPFDSVTPRAVERTSDLLREADRGLEAGTVIGDRYRVVDLLGQGGASMVYRAEHTALRKEVAVKVLKPELCVVAEAARRFQQEARAMSRLDHPNIVRITDFGRTTNGSMFLVMERAQGQCLGDLLVEQPKLQLSVVLTIALDVLEGLAHAHANGVVHRDLKPDNIMVDLSGPRPTAKVLDFGIAKLMECPDEGRLTMPGRVFGTPRYMAPEQAQGKEIDGRADLYALGACLYEMLEGRPAFAGDTAFEVLTEVVRRRPEPLTLRANPAVRTDRVAELVDRALRKTPRGRFKDAGEMIAAVRACFFFAPPESARSERRPS